MAVGKVESGRADAVSCGDGAAAVVCPRCACGADRLAGRTDGLLGDGNLVLGLADIGGTSGVGALGLDVEVVLAVIFIVDAVRRGLHHLVTAHVAVTAQLGQGHLVDAVDEREFVDDVVAVRLSVLVDLTRLAHALEHGGAGTDGIGGGDVVAPAVATNGAYPRVE